MIAKSLCSPPSKNVVEFVNNENSNVKFTHSYGVKIIENYLYTTSQDENSLVRWNMECVNDNTCNEKAEKIENVNEPRGLTFNLKTKSIYVSSHDDFFVYKYKYNEK